MDYKTGHQNDNLLPVFTPLIATSRPQIDILTLFDSADKNMIWFITYFFTLNIMKGTDKPLFNNQILSVDLLNNCPMLETHLYNLEMIFEKWNSFSEFIFDQINKGYYVLMAPDVYYIQAYKLHYNKNHFPHAMLTYGFNETENVIYAQDFFYIQLEQVAINIQQIEKAMRSQSVEIEVYCFKKKKYHHTIDLKFMLKILQYHLESKSIYEDNAFLLQRNINKYVCGMNYYNELKIALQKLHFNEATIDGINHHTCHALYDHCKILYAFIQYLYHKNYLNNNPKIDDIIMELIEKSQIFQNLCLKYNAIKNKNLLLKIIDILSQIKEGEEALLIPINEQINKFYEEKTRISPISNELYDLIPMCDISKDELYDDDNLLFTITGDDPVLMNTMVTKDADIFKYIYIKYLTTSISGTAQIFFGISKSSISETKSVSFTYSPCDDHITYIIDMTRCADWNGMIYCIRFDPAIFNNKQENAAVHLKSFEISDKLPVYNSAFDFCKTQGVNGWFYYSCYYGITTYKELLWDTELWKAHNIEELKISSTYQTSYHNVASVRKWVCHASGEYEINAEYKQRNNNNLVSFMIKYDLQTVLNAKHIDANVPLQGVFEKKLNMKIGEALYFEFYNASQREYEYLDVNITIKKLNDIILP